VVVDVGLAVTQVEVSRGFLVWKCKARHELSDARFAILLLENATSVYLHNFFLLEDVQIRILADIT